MYIRILNSNSILKKRIPKLKFLVLVPHLGSASLETRTRMAIIAAENLADALKVENLKI